MRRESLPRRALFFLCVLAAAALGLWRLDIERRGGPARADEAAARAPEPAPAALVPAAASEDEAPPARETVSAEPAEHGEAASTAAPLTPVSGVRLRGVLRFSHDSRPAPGQPLGFLSGAAHERVVTDALGRFETEAVFPTGFVYAWHALEGEERARAMPLDPSQIIVRDEFAGERVQEVELVLVEPDAWLHVQVTADGDPALATLQWRTPNASGTGTTDASGRGALALSRLEPGVEVGFWAETRDAVSARARRVFPWPDELVPLALRPAARIRARVHDALGAPLEDELVSVDDGPGAWTDGDGEARIDRVFAGDAVVRCDAERKEVKLLAGEELALEFVLPARELVAAGRVLDEDERPLEHVFLAAAHVQGAEPFATASSDAAGHFELRARPGQAGPNVWVSAAGGVESELYEPREQSAPTGSAALVFRRRPAPEVCELSLVAIDPRTGRQIHGARIFLYRLGSPWNFDLYGAPMGVATCTLRPYDDVLVRASAVGFVARTIAWRDVPASARAGKPLSLELARGFEHELEVLDDETLRPLAGARVLAGDLPVATSDDRGRVRVRLEAWPPSLRVELVGYAEQVYDQKEIVCSVTISCRLRRQN